MSGADEDDIAVSGGSGWEDFGTDEAKLALESYHNNVCLFEDADDDGVSTASTATPMRDNRSLVGGPSSSSGEGGGSPFLATGFKSNKKGHMNRQRGGRVSICRVDARFLCRMAVSIALLSLGVGVALFFTTDLDERFQSMQMKSNYLTDSSAVMTKVPVPKHYENSLHDVTDPPVEGERTSTPLLWDIPGDGDVYQHVMSSCLKLVAAGGALGDPRQTDVKVDQPLEVFQQSDGKKYVNVFAGDMKGIYRAKSQRLLESDLADVVYSPLIYEAVTKVFDENHRGRMFAMFHHPVHRISSIYHITRTITPELQNMTLAEWYATPGGANNHNWLTRELSGGHKGKLDEEHFQIAKDILRSKCLVGLSTHLDASLERFINYFNWTDRTSRRGYERCVQSAVTTRGLDRLYFDLIEENSAEWNLTAQSNEYDMRLHEFVEMLFSDQLESGIVMGRSSSSATSSAPPGRRGVTGGAPTFASVMGLVSTLVLGYFAVCINL